MVVRRTQVIGPFRLHWSYLLHYDAMHMGRVACKRIFALCAHYFRTPFINSWIRHRKNSNST